MTTITASAPVRHPKQPVSLRPRRFLRYEVLAVPVALVLLGAALLKGHELATRPVPGRTFWMILQVLAEGVLGLVLLWGLHRRWTWLLSCLSFALFTGVTFHKALTGQSNCGCFGQLTVKPWHAFALDAGILLALVLLRPRWRAEAAPRFYAIRLALLAAAILGAGIPASRAMLDYVPGALKSDGRITGDPQHVVVEPEGWLQRPLPLMSYIELDGKATFKQGRWTVVFYQHQCPHCQATLDQFLQPGGPLPRARGSRLALVEIAPYAPARPTTGPSRTAYTYGRLKNDREWFVATPLVAWLEAGKVTAVYEHDRVAKALKPVTPSTRPAAPPPSGPVLSPEASSDLGFVDLGTTRTVTYSVTNPLNRKVNIRKVTSECACMSLAKGPAALEAAAAASFQVKFEAPKTPLQYNKRIMVLTEDPQLPAIALRLRARVGLALAVEPEILDLGTLIQGEVRRRNFALRNWATQPVRLLYGTSSEPGATALVPPALVPPLGHVSLGAQLSAQAKPPGPRTITLQIATDGKSQPTVNALLHYTVSDAYSIAPGQVDLEPLAPGEKRRVVLVLATRSSQGKAWVEACQFTAEQNLGGQVQVTYSGQQASILCDLIAGPQIGLARGSVSVKLSGLVQPVAVPISGLVRRLDR